MAWNPRKSSDLSNQWVPRSSLSYVHLGEYISVSHLLPLRAHQHQPTASKAHHTEICDGGTQLLHWRNNRAESVWHIYIFVRHPDHGCSGFHVPKISQWLDFVTLPGTLMWRKPTVHVRKSQSSHSPPWPWRKVKVGSNPQSVLVIWSKNTNKISSKLSLQV